MNALYFKMVILSVLQLLKATIKNPASQEAANRIAWEIQDTISILFPRTPAALGAEAGSTGSGDSLNLSIHE